MVAYWHAHDAEGRLWPGREDHIFELIKKGLLAGMGAGVVTRDLVNEATAKLVEEGRLTGEEARALADRLVESGRRQWEEVEGEARRSLQNTVEAMGLARQQDLEPLRERLRELERLVGELSLKLDGANRTGGGGETA